MKEIVYGNCWKWPEFRSSHLLEIKNLVNFKPLRGEDRVVWVSNNNVKFFINFAWNEIRRKKK